MAEVTKNECHINYSKDNVNLDIIAQNEIENYTIYIQEIVNGKKNYTVISTPFAIKTFMLFKDYCKEMGIPYFALYDTIREEMGW